MTPKMPTRRVVRRWPSEQTAGGDYLQDDRGQVWRMVDQAEADSIRNSTAGTVGRLLPNGEIEP
jgi:hypothetical protein